MQREKSDERGWGRGEVLVEILQMILISELNLLKGFVFSRADGDITMCGESYSQMWSIQFALYFMIGKSSAEYYV